MKFEEILPKLREGKKIKKGSWWEGHYIIYDNNSGDIVNQNGYPYLFTQHDFNYINWEIIEEPKKIKLRDLTEEKLEIWMKTRCKKSCLNCPMEFAQCNRWINHKDLYSDKFLDQEIEIEVEK